MKENTVNVMALCAGFGMLEEGLAAGVRWLSAEGYRAPETAVRPVCFVEREVTAAAQLVERMEKSGVHHRAPVWDDVTTFNGRAWRGRVHCITAGYPCQPFSQAGRRRGTKDERHIWPHIARVISEAEPEEVLLENVSGHLSLGFPQVGRGLQDMGYRVKAGLFSAAETGARHERKRLVVLARRSDRIAQLANTQRQRLAASQYRRQPDPARPDRSKRAAAAEPRGVLLANATGIERGEAELRPTGEGLHRNAGPTLANTSNPRHRGRQSVPRRRGARRRWVQEPDRRSDGLELADAGQLQPGRRGGSAAEEGGQPLGEPSGQGGVLADTKILFRQGLIRGAENGVLSELGESGRTRYGAAMSVPLYAPGPSEYAAWTEILRHAPHLEPAIRRDADGMANRVDRLHGLGNGVVPLQIAYAYCTLYLAFVDEAQRLGG